ALALFDQIQRQAVEAGPYTVHDVTELEKGLDGHRLKKQSAQEFAEKIFERRGISPQGTPPSAAAGGPPAGAAPSHKHSATGKSGVKLYSDDGTNWFNPDGSSYTGQ